jgi:hypothetical protein
MKKKENMKDSNFKHFNPMALREKYSVGSTKRTNPFSSFWADNDWTSRRSEILDEERPVKKGVDHVALASYRRAISNFVSIVTNDSTIPVMFQSKGDSYTDGKKVTIGSKIDEKNFDPVVGLALHEGSHIKLSDFRLLRNLEFEIPEYLYELGKNKGVGRGTVIVHVKNMLNYVEDRRIDYHVFTTSPGYKGYYHSMYEKYFHSKVIDKALLTDEYTSLDWDSYMFRIINFTNKNRRLDVLPELSLIYDMIFRVNGGVKGLKSTRDALEKAVGIVGTVYNCLLDGVEETDENGEVSTKPASELQSTDGTELSDEEFEELKEKMENNEVTMSGGSDGGGEKVELTENQQKQLQRLIDKQKDFINGDVGKVGTLSKKDNLIVKTMEEAGVVHKDAGQGVGSDEYDYTNGKYIPSKGTKVVFVKKLTQTMIDERMFPSILRGYGRDNQEPIENGVRLGIKLGKKLQVRGESRDTKWSRKDTGKIDKRLVAELGFGNERVFETTFVESYSDAILHISIDASGSMNGEKWINTMTSTVAMCKAASMISNVDVVVSFRSTHDTSDHYRSRGGETFPLVLIGYDSRVDKFSKITRMWTEIYPGGTTPEGLCFEAIMNEIIPTSSDRDSFFLNFSDGMPMFSNSSLSYYYGDAINHTKKMVNEIRSKGIKVLSYFVGDSYHERENTMKDFKTMYGSDAEFIDVTNLISISKTMNKKFLEK